MAALYLPILVWLLWPHKGDQTLWRWICRRWYWAVPVLLIAGSYMALNQARFGNPLEFGHNSLPEFTRVPEGQFNLSYFWDNFKLLFRLPRQDASSDPRTFFTGQTMAFWLINPMYFCIAAAWGHGLLRRRNLTVLIMLPIIIVAHVFMICCHRTLGGWQFGNRYLLDMMPWLFAAFLLWMPEDDRYVRWSVPLLGWGAALNIIGTVATYRFWI